MYRKGTWYGWKPSSSSKFTILAFRAYYLIDCRQKAHSRALRGNSISVNSTLPLSQCKALRPAAGERCILVVLDMNGARGHAEPPGPGFEPASRASRPTHTHTNIHTSAARGCCFCRFHAADVHAVVFPELQLGCWAVHQLGGGSPVKDRTVSFHNFKSQNFKLSVSNPKNKYVAYLSVLSQI